MYQSIITEVDNSIGIITLNKADRQNALDELLIAEITGGLLELEANPQVRAVVLSSTGKSFCAGADINWLRRAASYTTQENLRDARSLAHLMATLNELSKPTIARVQGPAYGGGLGLIAACDIAVATYDTLFALTEVKLGLLPEIVPGEEQLDDAIGEIIDSLLKNGPKAQAECKALIRVLAGQPIDESANEETAQRITRVHSNPEGKEGLAAFLEKRKPNWIA